MERHFVSFPKSGRSWLRYSLTVLGVAKPIRFHHDGFEFNDAAKPMPDTSLEKRLRYPYDARIVYLSRDPLDVMVSFYFQITGRFRDFFHYDGTISQFVRDDYFGAHQLAQFRRIWQEMCRQGHAHEISYEDCHRDFAGVLRRVVDVLGVEADEAAIADAAQASTFARMQAVEQSGEFTEPWMRLRNGAPKLRRGKAGGYRDYLAKEDIAYLRKIFEDQ
ncbi:MAG: sulfotransferase domain-containing protein [Parvibaculaceae bacterium]